MPSLRLSLVDAARKALKGMKKPSAHSKKFIDASAGQLKGKTRKDNPGYMDYIKQLRGVNSELKKLAGEISPASKRGNVSRTSNDRFGRNDTLRNIFSKMVSPKGDQGGEEGPDGGEE